MWTLSQLQGGAWGSTLVAAAVAAVAALALHTVVRAVLRRVVRQEHAVIFSAMLERTQRAAGFALPLLALQAVWTAAPNDLPWIANVRHANGLGLIAAITALLMGAVGGLADGLIARHPANVDDNLHARRVQTQARVLSRSAMMVVLIGGCAMALMTFPGAKQLGASLLASAGVLGIVGGLAARPVFSNLIAGLQLALAQPIRIDDVLIVEGEYGRVEEITGTYVVMKLWDERRLIVPLQYFIEKPFQNWTRTGAQLHHSVYLYVDYATPIDPLRSELRRIVEAAPEWDGRTANLAVVDATENAVKLRALVSGSDSGRAGDLGNKVREELLAFLAREYPQYLPQRQARAIESALRAAP